MCIETGSAPIYEMEVEKDFWFPENKWCLDSFGGRRDIDRLTETTVFNLTWLLNEKPREAGEG